MAQHTLSGLPNIPITLRRSARAKRISLRVSGLDGRVTLTLPLGLAEQVGLNFAAQKSEWLRQQVGQKNVAGMGDGFGLKSILSICLTKLVS